MTNEDYEEFLSLRPSVSGRTATIEEIVWQTFWLYLNAEHKSDKERAAHLILRLQPIYRIQYMYLFDENEILAHGMELHRRIQKGVKASQKRRHQKREDFSLNDEDWTETLKFFDYSCAYCGGQTKLTYDHFIPFSKDGSFMVNNIVPACSRCNSSKRDRDAMSWYQDQKFYDHERAERLREFVRERSLMLSLT